MHLYQAATSEAKNKAKAEVPKKFSEWPLEAGSKSESIPIHSHVKMPNFTAEINMFTAWHILAFL